MEDAFVIDQYAWQGNVVEGGQASAGDHFIDLLADLFANHLPAKIAFGLTWSS